MPALAVAFIGGLLMLVGLGRIAAPIWDETYYLTATARTHEGRVQFASHPPLGMLLIAAGDSASGLNRKVDWQQIGADKTVAAAAMPAGFDYRGPRLASALAGLGVFLLFLSLARDLGLGPRGAAAACLLLLADTALLVQFRAAQLDSFQLLFAMVAMVAAARAMRGNHARYSALFGAAVMAAALVRANGVLIGVMALFFLWPHLHQRRWADLWRHIAAGAAGAAIIASLTLAATVLAGPRLPDGSTPAGRAHAAFVSPAHARMLTSGTWTASGVAAVVTDQLAYLRNELKITPSTDAHASHPAEWLIGRGSIIYWWDRSDGAMRAVGIFPNLVAWLISLAGVLSSLRPATLRRDPVRRMLLAAWIVNMAALQWLDHVRVLYIYHYFIPLLIGQALAVMEWRRLAPAPRYAAALLGAVALYGAALLPMVYGLPGWLSPPGRAASLPLLPVQVD